MGKWLKCVFKSEAKIGEYSNIFDFKKSCYRLDLRELCATLEGASDRVNYTDEPNVNFNFSDGNFIVEGSFCVDVKNKWTLQRAISYTKKFFIERNVYFEFYEKLKITLTFNEEIVHLFGIIKEKEWFKLKLYE